MEADDGREKRKVADEIDRPKKKASVSDEADEKNSNKGSTKAAPSYSLILEWSNYDVETDDFISKSISGDELIAQGICLGDTRAATECKEGENGKRNYSLKLVNTNASRTELATLIFAWWADSSQAHLMGFNQMSECRNVYPKFYFTHPFILLAYHYELACILTTH